MLSDTLKRSVIKKHQTQRAQAMVEFMLALPVLIMLLYGILEVSRLIFVFASVANASRQAARYGAGSGEIYNNVTYYQDCDGIRDVANKSAILIPFDNINITYDRGVTADGDQIPINGVDPSPDANTCPIGDNIIRNGDRIIVQVSASYKPIIPILPIQPLEVVSANARTFLISVPIFGSAFPTGFAAETSTPSKVPSRTPSSEEETSTPLPTNTRIPNQTVVALETLYPQLPTNTVPPTLSFTPSITPPPSSTPSITPSPISCTGEYAVSHGPLEFNNNIMRMWIYNATGYTLTTAQVYVEWNHDFGHTSDVNPTLHLNQVRLAGQAWTGDISSPSAFIPAYYPRIPTGESYIEFAFNQNYDVRDGTERIIITIGTPGCINYPVDSSK